MMTRNPLGVGSPSFSRNKRRGYSEVALDFVAQTFAAKEKNIDIAASFSRSNMALAVANNNTLVAYAAGIPRYDYDKSSNPLGLFFEPSVLQRLISAQGTSPSPNNMTTGPTVDGPGGTNNAVRFYEMTTSTHHRFTASYNTASPIGNTLTSNVIIRPVNRKYFYIRYAAGAVTYNIGFTFNPSANTMTCTYNVPGTTAGRVKYMGNGYWMLSATLVNSPGAMSALYFGSNMAPVTADDLNNVVFAGVATSGFDLYWLSVCDGYGAVTPWNVTTTGADLLTLPVALENSARFLVNVEFSSQDISPGNASVTPGVFKLSNAGSFSVGAYIRSTDMNLIVVVTNAAGTVIYTTALALASLVNNKLAIAYNGNTISVALNGALVATGTLTEVIPKMTTLALGRYDQGLYGYIRKAGIKTNVFSPSDVLKATV